MAIKLNDKKLSSLPEQVMPPAYDRTSLVPGIVHIGVGNFHRAHQAIYLDRLFASGKSHDWAIIGAGLKSYDTRMRDKLSSQDWLTTVVELDPKGLSARVCGAMIDFLNVDASALVERLSAADIRIVSLTITEGGYFVDPETGGFDSAHPDIQADIENPAAPQTVFGVLVAALLARREKGLAPFTVMSCDNLPENGHAARQSVVGFASCLSLETANWISENVAFPNGMVDCITPATGEREIALVRETFGVDDAAPVVCEPFRQWVLEDNFPAGRPALEAVGVEFVQDVAPYELMKLRMLNGGHAAIAYPAALLGYHFVHDAMADPLIVAFLEKLERTEIVPTLPDIPGVSFDAYLKSIVERFSNPQIGDTIPRLCLDGSNRQPKFIMPTILARLESGASIEGLALETALWCRYCLGRDENDQDIEVVDESADVLSAWARSAFSGPARPSVPEVFGPLKDHPDFLAAFGRQIDALKSAGVAGALKAYTD